LIYRVIDKKKVEEPLEGERGELYNLLFGDWEEETDEGEKEMEPPGGDDDDELYR